MPLVKAPNAEPIRGYRLIEHLGRGGFGEVWKCEAPGGIYKAIKFVYGDVNGLEDDSARAREELASVQHIKSIRHPFLLSIDRVECVHGELLLITELADQNLHEVFQEYRAKGGQGIPREQLLDYLREAAEVLDLMNNKFDLQHLDIKPRNLFLVSNHVKVADFGLVNSLAGGSGASSTKLQLGAITPIYAAPELFTNRLSRHCDQYSLAIVFQELLTGMLPFTGQNCRQLLIQHTQEKPDLSALSPFDQAIIGKALSKNPNDRYPSCMALIKALRGEVERRSGETMAYIDLETENLKPANLPHLPPKVLPDYNILEWQGANPQQESWLVQSPRGQKRVLKILYGCPVNDPKKIHEISTRLATAHHPAILEAEIVHHEPGRLAIVTDFVKETLRDRFQKNVHNKLSGVPRHELIEMIRAAAEVLDYLYQQHGLQHLALNPRQLVLDHGWLQITEFGLAQLIWLPAGQDVAQRNARYTAPELFDFAPSQTSDQYSLALIFAEMLTGTHPFQHLGNLARTRKRTDPDLSGLNDLERVVLTRALDPDPAKRWAGATEMLLALEGSIADSSLISEHADRFKEVIKASLKDASNHPSSSNVDLGPRDLRTVVNDIIAAAGGKLSDPPPQVEVHDDATYHKFQVNAPLGTAHTKLEAFYKRWPGRKVKSEENLSVYMIPLEATTWQRWRKQAPALEVRIGLGRVNMMSATPIEVIITLRPFDCNAAQAQKVKAETGPAIVEEIRTLLLSGAEKRVQDRLLWPHTIKVTPIHADGQSDDPIECRGKDLSHGGIGFFLPHELETADVLIEIPNQFFPPSVTIPATLVRAKPCPDGWYEVGAIFRFPSVRSEQKVEVVCSVLE
jgi:serine/threonine protein kinase